MEAWYCSCRNYRILFSLKKHPKTGTFCTRWVVDPRQNSTSKLSVNPLWPVPLMLLYDAINGLPMPLLSCPSFTNFSLSSSPQFHSFVLHDPIRHSDSNYSGNNIIFLLPWPGCRHVEMSPKKLPPAAETFRGRIKDLIPELSGEKKRKLSRSRSKGRIFLRNKWLSYRRSCYLRALKYVSLPFFQRMWDVRLT